jgi:hypothetical protein
MFEVVLRRRPRVLAGMGLMGVGELRMVRGLVVVAGILMFGGFGVVVRGHTVMMGCLAMFVRGLL